MLILIAEYKMQLNTGSIMIPVYNLGGEMFSWNDLSAKEWLASIFAVLLGGLISYLSSQWLNQATIYPRLVFVAISSLMLTALALACAYIKNTQVVRYGLVSIVSVAAGMVLFSDLGREISQTLLEVAILLIPTAICLYLFHRRNRLVESQ